MGLAVEERQKYEKVWKDDRYRVFSPGERFVSLFRQMVRPRRGSRLLDAGCGTGRAGVALSADFDVTLCDFVDARDEAAKALPFFKANLWSPKFRSQKGWDYIYCCDVLEHIPPSRVDAVLRHLTAHTTKGAFFSICHEKAHFKGEGGEPLHLTVQPFEWWLKKLGEYGTVKHARHLLQNGVFYVV